jgi:hypothetical protein
MQRCERREIWHGSDWKSGGGREPELDEIPMIADAGHRMMAGLRLFVAETPDDRRLRQRIEATVMLGLYDTASPLCDLPDRGMHLRPRRLDEVPITVTNVCTNRIYGLPETMRI